MLYKQVIYIEEKIKNHPNVLAILHKINPVQIIYINHYKDILNQNGGNWNFQKKFQKIVLAKREDTFLYKGSHLTPNFGFDLFYYNTLAINCLFDCSYCYLQGMYNTPHLVLFINNDDFIQATYQLINQHKEKKIYLALSYDTDLPVLEQYYPYCSEWINFASTQSNLNIEIRTKSNQIKYLENLKPNHNTILAWSILPDEIIQKFEPYSPQLNQRIKAINTAIEKGWKVMLCIDPLIAIPNYYEIYTSFIIKIAEVIPLDKIEKISVGTFRMNVEYYKNIKKFKHQNALYNYPYQIINNAVSYPMSIKKTLTDLILNQLKNLESNKIIIYE